MGEWRKPRSDVLMQSTLGTCDQKLRVVLKGWKKDGNREAILLVTLVIMEIQNQSRGNELLLKSLINNSVTVTDVCAELFFQRSFSA